MVANGDEPATETLFLVSSVAITIWAFVLGVMLWRGASASVSVSATLASATR